jgi:hypothetical protein
MKSSAQRQREYRVRMVARRKALANAYKHEGLVPLQLMMWVPEIMSSELRQILNEKPDIAQEQLLPILLDVTHDLVTEIRCQAAAKRLLSAVAAGTKELPRSEQDIAVTVQSLIDEVRLPSGNVADAQSITQ